MTMPANSPKDDVTNKVNPDSVRFNLIDLVYAALLGYAFSIFDSSVYLAQTLRWIFAFAMLIIDYLFVHFDIRQTKTRKDFAFDLVILFIISRSLQVSTAKELQTLFFVQTTDQELKYWAAFFGWVGILFLLYSAWGVFRQRDIPNYGWTLIADFIIGIIFCGLCYAANLRWIPESNPCFLILLSFGLYLFPFGVWKITSRIPKKKSGV